MPEYIDFSWDVDDELELYVEGSYLKQSLSNAWLFQLLQDEAYPGSWGHIRFNEDDTIHSVDIQDKEDSDDWV